MKSLKKKMSTETVVIKKERKDLIADICFKENSFPEKLPTSRDNEKPVSNKNHCSQLAIPSVIYLSTIRHTFSHFHLEIQPKLVKVSKNEFKLDDSKHRVWYSLKNPPTLGLAAPVKKLLAEL